jgi:hypothetical protein
MDQGPSSIEFFDRQETFFAAIRAREGSLDSKGREFELHTDESDLLKRFNLLLCISSIVQLRDE